MQVISVILGGAFGALSRYLIYNGSYILFSRDFPYATWFVNCLGCFLAGFIFTLLLTRFDVQAGHYRAFLLIGFLGSFTTFSTFALETWQLLEHGFFIKAFANMALNLLCSLAAVWIGLILGKYYLSSQLGT